MTRTKVEVRLPDCDGMGIVHHAVYPIWYEIGRNDFFEQCGFGYARTRAEGIDPAMVHLEMDYGAPLTYPGAVVVETRLTLCEGKKLGFSYAIRPEGELYPCAIAKSLHIWVRDGKSVPLDEALPDMYAALKARVE